MAEMNQFSFYSMNSGFNAKQEEDKIDKCIVDLRQLNEYKEVCEYINTHFGTVENERLFNYPELNKQVFIAFKENAVEVFAAKNKKQFFSKGWKHIKKDCL